jgi:hypothetical protein
VAFVAAAVVVAATVLRPEPAAQAANAIDSETAAEEAA